MNNVRLRNTDPKYSLEHIPSEKLITGLYLILDHLLKLRLKNDKNLNSVNEMLGDHVIFVLKLCELNSKQCSHITATFGSIKLHMA